MNFSPESFLDLSITVVLAMLCLAMLLGFVRLVLGPTLPDRVVALDLIGTLSVGIIAVYAVKVDEPVFLLPAIVLALIMFIGTIAFAYYVQKGGLP